MADPTPERQGLRERIEAALRSTWDGAPTVMEDAIREEANAVLAVLVEPPGDLREQMAAAILDMPNPILGGDTHRQHNYAMGCPICKGDAQAIAEVAASVRWEDAARRIAAAETRADKAEYDLEIRTHTARSNGRAHRVAYLESEKQRERAEAAENERDLLREALGESDLGAQVLAQWEAIAAADADRDRLEEQVAALQRELAEARTDRDTNFSVLQRVGKGGWEAATELVNERIARKQAEGKLTAAKRAVQAAQAAHIREARHDRPVVGDCAVCCALLAISRDLPSRPDDPEEIRRLAENTETET